MHGAIINAGLDNINIIIIIHSDISSCEMGLHDNLYAHITAQQING